MMDLKQQLETAIKVAQKASVIIQKIYKTNFKADLKADNTYVTEADYAADKYIREELAKAFPKYGMLSEESADDKSRLDKDFCWIIDPLDGTKDFVNHTDEFSINIALCYKHKIVLGVIAIPVKKILYYATLNNGAHLLANEKETKIHVSNRTNNLILLKSHFFFSKKDEDYLKTIKEITKYEACGSSYKACLIASGSADLCTKFVGNTKQWDIAASDIIIKEAGGVITDMYGKEIIYNTDNVFNTHGFLIANNETTINLVKINIE